MALGDSSLKELENLSHESAQIINQKLRDEWNSFHYVTNKLDAWAGDTTIGKEARQNLIKLCDDMDRLLTNTCNILSGVDNFANSQGIINSGTGIVSNADYLNSVRTNFPKYNK